MPVAEAAPRDFGSAVEKEIVLWRQRYARPKQLAPEGDWRIWLMLAGRGFGKTRAGAEDVKIYGLTHPGSRIAVGAPTFGDARDVCFEGESGLLSVLPAGTIRRWNRSNGELYLTNGSYYKIVPGEKPARARGPQWHRIWADEIAEWRYPETFWNLMLGLRLGDDPRAVATGTPKPVQLVRELVESPDTVVTQGSTYENRENLPENVFREIMARYEGTALGRQEIYGELLSELPGALWTREVIERCRVSLREAPAVAEMSEVVVAIDPEGAWTGSSETGMVVAGRLGGRKDGVAYVIADASGRYSPEEWSGKAADLYRSYEADVVVAETNFGGDMVRSVLRQADPDLPLRLVRASRGKVLRAEPVVALYERGRVRHIGGHPALEDQMCSFSRDEQPLGTDRVDALVYAVTYLLLSGDTSERRGRALRGEFFY